MEPQEINGGRFYLRPLISDERINDDVALRHLSAPFTVADSRDDWARDTAYRWAICEQTCVDLVALCSVTPVGSATLADGTPARVTVDTLGDPSRNLPVDPGAIPVTAGEAAAGGLGTARRWVEGFLGYQVVDATDGTTAPARQPETTSQADTPQSSEE